MYNGRKADIFQNNNGGWVVYMTEIENGQIVFDKAVTFETEDKANIAKKHFLGEYSGFDPIGDWED